MEIYIDPIYLEIDPFCLKINTFYSLTNTLKMVSITFLLFFLKMNLITYNNNERGNHAIAINNLEQLHNELGVSAEWLLFEKEPIFWKDIQFIEKKENNPLRKDLFLEEMNEMKDILERVPIIRHSVMGHYQDCKIRYKDIIAETLGK